MLICYIPIRDVISVSVSVSVTATATATAAVTNSSCVPLVLTPIPLLAHTPQSVRERWLNLLDPSLDHSPWTTEAELELVRAHNEHGNKWQTLTTLFVNRSENNVKNKWHSSLRSAVERFLNSLPRSTGRVRDRCTENGSYNLTESELAGIAEWFALKWPDGERKKQRAPNAYVHEPPELSGLGRRIAAAAAAAPFGVDGGVGIDVDAVTIPHESDLVWGSGKGVSADADASASVSSSAAASASASSSSAPVYWEGTPAVGHSHTIAAPSPLSVAVASPASACAHYSAPVHLVAMAPPFIQSGPHAPLPYASIPLGVPPPTFVHSDSLAHTFLDELGRGSTGLGIGGRIPRGAINSDVQQQLHEAFFKDLSARTIWKVVR